MDIPHQADNDSDEIILRHYLETLQKLDGLNDQEFEQLPKKSHSFLVHHGHLYKRSKKGHPPQQAVGKLEQREGVLHVVHEFRARGQQVSYDQLHRRYQWKDMYNDMVKCVRSREECQHCSRI